MERREKCLERVEKREGLMVEKLKHGVVVGKSGRRSSTPPPTWRLEFPSQQNGTVQQEFLNFSASTLSARNLCAKLWEFHSHQLVPHSNSHSPSNQVTPDNHVNPIISLNSKGEIEESSCNPKSSKELVKVLDRIWRLEEQHASNVATVKAAKMELDLSQAQVKELLQEKKMNKQEMKSLMKKITEDKLVNKNKEHDKIKALFKSVKEEIEDERRLRKHSESLHQKLTTELSEVKSSFRSTLRNLKRERKSRILLENLCDDFAKGVKDYEHEIHSIMHHDDKDRVKGDGLDRLILHISEAWLDERMQMKLVQDGSGSDLPETHSIVDKLHVDIETFLRAKRSIDLKRHSNSSTKDLKETYPCLHSLDSFKVKETINSPHNMSEKDSVGTDIFEQKRTSEKGLNKLNYRKHNNNTKEIHKEKKRSQSSMSKQVQSKEILKEYFHLQENAVKNMSCEIIGDISTLLNAPRVSTVCYETIQGPPESDKTRTKRINSSHSLIGKSSMSSEGDKVYPESICREDSCVHSAVNIKGSPVKEWKTTLIVPDFNKGQSPYKLPKGVKDNTFMAKLLEARLEGCKSSSKHSKTSF